MEQNNEMLIKLFGITSLFVGDNRNAWIHYWISFAWLI